MTPMFHAMKAFLHNRWGLATSPEEKAALEAQRRAERSLVDVARSSEAAMDALVNAVQDGSLVMRRMGISVGTVSPMGLAVSTWTEVCDSKFHALRVDTMTNGSENFLSTVYLNGVALKGQDPASERLSAVAREASGAPARTSGLDVGLDPATTRPRMRR